MSGALTSALSAVSSVPSAVGSIGQALSNLSPPPSQQYRTIGFTLTGGLGATLQFTFNIRPEDLRVPEPSRMGVQQTMGGTLLDSFGAGISTITLSGTNGWRGSQLLSGEALFSALRDAVFAQWHRRRQQQITLGKDPNAVKLTFVDTLDKITVYVVPQTFTLMRSRASPLLKRYSIEMTVLGPVSASGAASDSILDALSNPLRWLASVTGLGNVLGELQSLYSTAVSYYAAALPYVGAFLTTVQNVLRGVQVLTQLASPGGVLAGNLAPILATGKAVALAGANVFHAIAATAGLTNQAVGAAIAVAQSCLDAACLIGNGFSVGLIYNNFDAMLGASMCSSTGGGEDWSAFTLSNANPFESLFSNAPAVPDVSVTSPAQQGLVTLGGDVLLLAQAPATVAAAAAAVATGVTVNPTFLALAA